MSLFVWTTFCLQLLSLLCSLKKIQYRSATITCKAILVDQHLVSIFDSKTISGTIYIEKSCLIQQFVTNGELQSSVIAAVTIFIWVGRVSLFISASWFSSNIYWIMLMLAYGTASWKFCAKGVENFYLFCLKRVFRKGFSVWNEWIHSFTYQLSLICSIRDRKITLPDFLPQCSLNFL